MLDVHSLRKPSLKKKNTAVDVNSLPDKKKSI